MADVAGTPLRATMEVAVRDDACPDARPDLHHDHVGVAGRDAGPPLAQGEDVDVVVDPDRRPVAGGESLADRIAVPAGHDRRRDGPARLEFDRPGHADADPPQSPRQPLRRPDERIEQRIDAREADVRTGLDQGRLVVMAEDPAIEGRDRDVDAGGAQVRDQQVAVVGPEGQLAWRPPAGARSDVALADEAALDQLADPLGDDRPAEPCPGHQFGARPRPPEADLVEHVDQRVERLVGQWREPAGVLDDAVVGLDDHRRMIRRSAQTPTFALDMAK